MNNTGRIKGLYIKFDVEVELGNYDNANMILTLIDILKYQNDNYELVDDTKGA